MQEAHRNFEAFMTEHSLVAEKCDVAIVGAGAAGLATAIFAGRTNPNVRVVVLDGARRIGAKILVSGGGRCNVTNTRVTDLDFWGGRRAIIRKVLRSFPVSDTVAFFEELGMALHEETDGKLFPNSNRARDVLEALQRETARVGVDVRSHHRVWNVMRSGERFTIDTSAGSIAARKVVLATGGQSLPKTGSDGAGYRLAEQLGHTLVDRTPALVPLLLSEDHRLHQQLSGVAHDAELTLWTDDRVAIRLRGALLWTHFGVSGPVALNMSRHWARAEVERRQPKLTANFCAGMRFEEVEAKLLDLARERPHASVKALLSTWMPASMASSLTDALHLEDEPCAALPRNDRRRVTHSLVEWPLPVTATRGYTHAEATAGGVSLTEIDPATMESRVCRGLFLVGEILDVDGRLGGFNFQWAWASARAAARGLVANGPERS